MAYVTHEMIREMERKYGKPRHLHLSFEIRPPEMNMLQGSKKHDRNHDLTLFIFRDRGYREFAAIAKHMFPEGAYRAPSGAANPGEPLEEAARREAREETGLDISLDRFILHIHARFTCGPVVEDWRSLVFTALWEGGQLGQLDEDEIRETRWVTLEELQGPVREKLLATGMGLFAYRVALHDASVEEIEKLRASRG
ncbi:NUDIX domain-containing protein [Candidatus Solincola sp.]|nr:NUDIX hydrolase [Actinomycetota bacterium]MDI7252455.1 NUDIX hydrolase [Actinomycetota bacterium]